MFGLTHNYINLEVLKKRKLSQEQENLLVLGSLISDVSEFNFIPKGDTHDRGLDFFKSLSKKYYYFGVGLVLHGENPKGLDYYTHFEYLPKKEKEIKKIIKIYKKVFSKKTDYSLMAHIITEFCFEYLTAQKNSEIIKKVNKTFKNKISNAAFYNLANFFNINSRHTKIIIQVARSGRLQKFFSNFKTIRGTAHNFQYFIFLKQIRDKGKEPSWLDRFTKSSYRFLKSRFKEKQFEQMFARCIESVRKDYDPFMNQSIKNLKKLVKDKKL